MSTPLFKMVMFPAFSLPLTVPLSPARASSFLSSTCIHPVRAPVRTFLKMTTTPTAPPPSANTITTDQPPRLQLPDTFPTPPQLTVLGHNMNYTPITGWRRLAMQLRLMRQLRGRLAKGTILTLRLSGALSERTAPARLFSKPELTLPLLMNTLRLAAYDPRISHLHLRIDPLTCGWGKVLELRRHIDFFAAAGKTVTAYMETGGPKEFFIAMGYATYVPPEGSLSLRGFASSGTFVRGVLDKIGIDPQVERIGEYKSAGDQLSRRDMSSAQREVLNAILNDINQVWSKAVTEATGISLEALTTFIDRSPWKMEEYTDAGLITGTCYESDLIDALKLRFARRGMFGTSDEEILRKSLPSVDIARYSRRVSPRMFKIEGSKRIAVIRAVGAITPGKSGSTPVSGPTVGSDTLVELIRKVRDDKRYVGVILRCDSPGGAALSSDIVWHELKALRAIKPIVASQVDVAGSGGYFLSMACEIVSEPLSLTGSVGVVTAKPSLAELYRKIGYSKENISVGGRFAELLVEDRPFSSEELDYFRKGARFAYDQFVAKAAESRGKTIEDMESVAQGRVWTGLQAKERGLVDHIGGMARAIEVLKERCEIKDDFVKVEEVQPPVSLAERIGLSLSSTEPISMGSGPLAIAELDGALSGFSPVTKAVLDSTIAPVLHHAPGLVNHMPGLINQIARVISTSI